MKLCWLDREETVTGLVVLTEGDDFVVELAEMPTLRNPKQKQVRAHIRVGDVYIHIEAGRVSVAGGTVATSGPMYFDRRR